MQARGHAGRPPTADQHPLNPGPVRAAAGEHPGPTGQFQPGPIRDPLPERAGLQPGASDHGDVRQ